MLLRVLRKRRACVLERTHVPVVVSRRLESLPISRIGNWQSRHWRHGDCAYLSRRVVVVASANLAVAANGSIEQPSRFFLLLARAWFLARAVESAAAERVNDMSFIVYACVRVWSLSDMPLSCCAHFLFCCWSTQGAFLCLTDGCQKELACWQRLRNAHHRHSVLDGVRLRQQHRHQRVGFVATGPSIQLDALRDEPVLIVDFNGKMKRMLWSFIFVQLLFIFSSAFFLVARSVHLVHHDSLGADESWIQVRRGTERHRSCCKVRLQNFVWLVCCVYILAFLFNKKINSCRSVKSQVPCSITCNDGSTLRGAKCSSSMLGRGSLSEHTCLNVGSLGAKQLKYVTDANFSRWMRLRFGQDI